MDATPANDPIFHDIFPRGEVNPYGEYFIGQSYLAKVLSEPFPISNVTFEPGCRNNWHVHGARTGGGQVLLCTAGRGWYQLWGEPIRELSAGSAVFIPAGVKHWHGAQADSWFSHVAFEAPGEGTSLTWLGPVSDEDYPDAAR